MEDWERSLRQFPEGAAHVEPKHVRQVHIDDCDVEPAFPSETERVAAGSGLGDVEAGTTKHTTSRIADRLVVLDKKDEGWSLSR